MDAPSRPDFPVNTVQFAAVVDGTHTDFVISSFSNRIFVAITQYEKLGTLIHASKDVKVDLETPPSYTVRTLLGKRDEPLLLVYARQLIEIISSATDKPLLLSIALKPETVTPAQMQAVLGLLKQNKVW
eukprot:Opistho-2@66682